MEAIRQAAINTPLWVYVLFIYLFMVGFKATKTRVISLKKTFIIPILLVVMSVHTLLTEVPVNLFTVGLWTGGITLGTLLGWWQVYRYKIEVDTKKHLIKIPGTWTTAIVILIIFSTKYYLSYEFAIDPALANQKTFEFIMLGISGACTGLFIGRLLCYIYRMKTGTHVNLTT